MATKRLSPVMKLLTLLWDGRFEATDRSYTRLNDGMRTALNVAITTGMPFAANDVKDAYESFSGSYWLDWENVYSIAAKVGNLSACKSVESWKNRPPFIYDGKRLAVGSEFVWAGAKVTVTSFGTQAVAGSIMDAIIACSHKVVDHTKKVVKRYTLTVSDLKAQEKVDRPPPQKPEIPRFMKEFPELFRCSDAREFMRQFTTLKEAWMGCGDPEFHKMRESLKYMEAPVTYAAADRFQTCDDIRAALDFDRDIAPLLARFQKRTPKAKPEQPIEEAA